MKISEIKINYKNPRKIDKEKLSKLAESIKNFPKMMELRPIVIDENGMILGGNMRYKALVKLNYKDIPEGWVKVASGLTPDEERRFIIEDNLGFGDWDWEILKDEWNVEELNEWGLEFTIDSEDEIETIHDDIIPDEVESICKIGDLWQLGKHRLLCGDSAIIDDVEKLMNSKKADMVFTDPPYGVGYVGKTKEKLKIKNDDLSKDDLSKNIIAWFSCVDLAIRDGAYVMATIPSGLQQLYFLQDWVNREWLRQVLVWNKSSIVLGHSEYHYKHELILFGWKRGKRLKSTDRTKNSVWDFEKPNANREHPTMKPVIMWEYGIKNHTRKGDLLYEPFTGSGTTIIACEKTNRICYGMEIDPHYCDVIIKRWENYTGGKAEKINARDY